jgi:LysM repeat protein
MGFKKKLLTYFTAATIGLGAIVGNAFAKSDSQIKSLDSMTQDTASSYSQIINKKDFSSKENDKNYTVKKGDTLIEIANEMSKKYNQDISFVDIAKYNNLENPNIIGIGDNLKIPIREDISSYSKKDMSESDRKPNSDKNTKLEDTSNQSSLDKKKNTGSKKKGIFSDISPILYNPNNQDLDSASDINIPISPNYKDLDSVPDVNIPISPSSKDKDIVEKDNLEKIVNQKPTINEYIIEYKVQKGDSYWRIGKLFDTSYKSIQAQNNNKPLHPNQVIKFNINPESLKGYTLDKEKNWDLILSKSPSEIVNDRKKIGVRGLAYHLDIDVGSVAYGEERKQNIYGTAKEFVDAGRKYNISPLILAAIRSVESGGRNKTISPTGCLGPDGLTTWIYGKNTWSDGKMREGINPFDSKESNYRKAEFLRVLLDNYKDVKNKGILAITAYNQGETVISDLFEEGAKKLNYVSDSSKETMKYVMDNMQIKDLFQLKYSSGKKKGQAILSSEGQAYAFQKVLNEKKRLKQDSEFLSLLRKYNQ